MHRGLTRLIGLVVFVAGLGQVTLANAAPVTDIQAGQTAFRNGKYADAIARLSRVIARGKAGKSALAKVFYMRGASYQQLDRLTPAIADFSNAIWLDELPAALQARAYMRRGKLRLAMSQHAQALKDMNEAVRLVADAAGYSARGEALIRLGMPSKAIKDLDTALGKASAIRHHIYYVRAQAFEALGRKADAIANLRKSLSLKPAYAPAGQMLAALGGTPNTALALRSPIRIPKAGGAPDRPHMLITGSIRQQAAKPEKTAGNVAERDWMSATRLKRLDTSVLRKSRTRPIAAARPKPRTGSGAYVLQLSALQTLETAKIALHHIASVNRDLLGGKSLFVEKAKSLRFGDIYRVRLGPFSAQKEPLKLCGQLKSRGQACFLTRR